MTMALAAEPYTPQRGRASTIHVLIVDDHTTFAELLAMALETESDFVCVGMATTGVDAMEIAMRTRPDIVVMDIQLGNENGLDVARRIREALPEVVVAVVSAHRDPSWVAKAAQAGASAFAPKTGSFSEMLHVLRGATKGSMLVAPSLFRQVVTTAAEPRRAIERLTAREQEVLLLMGKGIAPADMAHVLNIRVNTCRSYVKAIHSKLGVRSQLEAVVKAQQLGLIDLSGDH
jgi:DNA-binding NarL/FixJ family response regulator